MTQYECFLKAVEKSKEVLKTVSWTSEQIDQNFGKRNLQEIFDSGEVPFGACFERELAISYLSLEAGIEVTLATMSLWRPYLGMRLRTGIEVQLDGQDFVFHPTENKDDFYKGKMPYKLSHKLSFPKIVRANMSSSLDLSWFDHFGIYYIEQLEETFPGLNRNDVYGYAKRLNGV